MKKLLKSLFCLLMFFGLVCVVTGCKETQPAEEVDVLGLFADDGSNTYTLTNSTNSLGDPALEVAADKTNVAADKVLDAALVADLSGKDLSNMNRLAFTVKGSCQIIIEIASGSNAVSVELALTANEKGFQWDLSGVEEQAILDAGNVKVSVYAMKGKNEGVANITLTYVTFNVADAVYNAITSGYTNIDPAFNNYDGTSSSFDVNDKWTENDKGTYTTTKQDDGSVKVDYNLNGWNYMYAPVAGAFGKFTHVTIKVTSPKGQGVTFKVEGSGIAVEKQFKCNGELQIASIDLTGFTEAQRNNIERVLVFATATGAPSQNSLTIHECYFGMEDETYLGILEGETLVYNDVNENGINVTNDFDFNGNKKAFWTDAYKTDTKTLVYTVKNDNSPWEITWDKAANQNEVPLIVNVQGNFGNFSQLKFGIELASGVKYRVDVLDGAGKVLASKASVGNGTGPDNQVIDFEAEGSKLTVAERNSIAQIKIYTDYENTAANTGTMKIHWFNIANYVGFRGVPTDKLTNYDGSNNINLNAAKDTWRDNGSGLFTVTSDASPWEISYTNKPAGDWSYVVQYVKSNGLLGNFSKLVGGLTIPAGVNVIVKVEGSNLGQYWDEERKSMSNEIALVGNETGSYQGFELDLSGHTVAQRNSIHSIIILIDYNNETVKSGSIKVDWMGMSEYKNQKVEPLKYDGEANSFDVNSKWTNSDEGVYVVTSKGNNDASPWVVSYDKRSKDKAWASLSVAVEGDFSVINKIHCGISLPEGADIIVKVQNADGSIAAQKELKGDADVNNPQQIIIEDWSKLTADQKKQITKVLIFVEFNQTEEITGSYEIHWFAFEK